MSARGGCKNTDGCEDKKIDCSHGLESLKGPCEMDGDSCSVILPEGLNRTEGMPPGAFTVDFRCTGDSLLFLANGCWAGASSPGPRVVQTCLVGPPDIVNGTVVKGPVPLVTYEEGLPTRGVGGGFGQPVEVTTGS